MMRISSPKSLFTPRSIDQLIGISKPPVREMKPSARVAMAASITLRTWAMPMLATVRIKRDVWRKRRTHSSTTAPAPAPTDTPNGRATTNGEPFSQLRALETGGEGGRGGVSEDEYTK